MPLTTGTKLLIAGQNAVSVHSLRPYEGWPALRKRLRRALNFVQEVTPLTTATMISLHYINKIVVPYPKLVADDFSGFIQRTASRLSDGLTRAIETFATLPSAGETTDFLLDLDFQRHDLTIDDLDDVLTIADQLKVQENTEFESCLKEPARALSR